MTQSTLNLPENWTIAHRYTEPERQGQWFDWDDLDLKPVTQKFLEKSHQGIYRHQHQALKRFLQAKMYVYRHPRLRVKP